MITYLSCLIDGNYDGHQGYEENTGGIVRVLVIEPQSTATHLEYVKRRQHLLQNKLFFYEFVFYYMSVDIYICIPKQDWCMRIHWTNSNT